MGIAFSFVLSREKAAIPAADILRQFNARYPELQASLTATESSERTVSFHTTIGDVVIAEMGASVPWSDLEGPCATSLLWRDATAELRQHRSHIIVTVISDAEPVRSAEQLTKATAVVLAASELAMGVLWGNAMLIVPKPLFLEMSEHVLPTEAPLAIWVDFRVGRADDQHSSGFTQGLVALGHLELEAERAPEAPAALRERLENLARYLVANGPVIRDGDSVGYDADERIRVVFGGSAFGSKSQVMRLLYESPT